MTKIFEDETRNWGSLYEEPGGGRYAIFQKNARERTARRMRACIEMIDPHPGDLVLDVGCGTGAIGRGVLERGARWVGVDVALPMLREGRKLYGSEPRAAWIQANATSLPIGDGAFERAICIGMLNFYPAPALPGLLGELNRILARRGVLVLTSLRLDVLTWIRSRLYPRVPLPLSSPGPLYPAHYRRLGGLLERAGFRSEGMLHARKYLGLPHYTMFRLRKP